MTDNERCIQLLEENILLQKKVEILTKALHAISDHQVFVFKGAGLSTIKHIADQAIAEVGKK